MFFTAEEIIVRLDGAGYSAKPKLLDFCTHGGVISSRGPEEWTLQITRERRVNPSAVSPMQGG